MDADFMENDLLTEAEPGHSNHSTKHANTEVTFKLYPGFECFFEGYSKENQLNFYQCYKKLMKSHFELQKVITPIETIFNNNDIGYLDKLDRINSRLNHN